MYKIVDLGGLFLVYQDFVDFDGKKPLYHVFAHHSRSECEEWIECQSIWIKIGGLA